MKISNVVEIYDNGEFITIITFSGCIIHLPLKTKIEMVIDDKFVDVQIRLVNDNE